jgi:hypothetical protein
VFSVGKIVIPAKAGIQLRGGVLDSRVKPRMTLLNTLLSRRGEGLRGASPFRVIPYSG